jgi:uncharacterized membrane protein
VKVTLLVVSAFIVATNGIENIGWGIITVCLIGIAAFLGALLPDIDHHSSIPRRRFDRIFRLVIPLAVVAMGWILVTDYLVSVSRDIKILLLIGLLVFALKLYAITPDLVSRIMPSHRGLLHDSSFWVVVGSMIATLVFIAFSSGPHKIGGVSIVPFDYGTTAATYAVGMLSLGTGSAVTLGAHQHLEQDGELYPEFTPGPIIRAETKLVEVIQRVMTEAMYRSRLAHVEEAAGIGLAVVSHAFEQLVAATMESVASKSLESFRKRLTARDVVVILLTFVVTITLIYLIMRLVKFFLSDSSGDSEAACPSSMNETVAELEGTNGTLEATCESVTMNRELGKTWHDSDQTTMISLEEVSAFNVSSPGLITDGYVHLDTEGSQEPRANILAHRNQMTVKCDDRGEMTRWTSEVDEIRDWKQSLSSAPDPLTYLAA